nr:type II 3-dehydroquinate dehydratase [Bacteroidota bacterium]
MERILIINGPNLNLLGSRETSIYGELSLEEIIATLGEEYPDYEITDLRSNEEGPIVTAIQQAKGKVLG